MKHHNKRERNGFLYIKLQKKYIYIRRRVCLIGNLHKLLEIQNPRSVFALLVVAAGGVATVAAAVVVAAAACVGC